MRRADKEIKERSEIDAILHEAEVCRLAFAADGEPHLVPVSFGYDGESLYFHTAKDGQKLRCIAANNRVCFEVERGVELVTDSEKACEWSFRFESVVGFGRVHELTAPEDKDAGLQAIMEHYSGRRWEFSPAIFARTRVWRIEISSLSGKRAAAPPKG